MLESKDATLVFIDVQGNLALLMYDKERLFRHLHALIKMANILGIPIIWTEQAPQKIGDTVPEFAEALKPLSPISKKSFSCYPAPEFVATLEKLKKKQIIICGIETHVCIYQTVADLLNAKYEVYVVADAVSSRKEEDKKIALDRMRTEGATLVSTEMLATELLRTAEHPKFKEILKLIR